MQGVPSMTPTLLLGMVYKAGAGKQLVQRGLYLYDCLCRSENVCTEFESWHTSARFSFFFVPRHID